MSSLPLALQIHLVAVVCAILVGPIALYRKRKDTVHKTAGYVWICAMFLVAVSSFGLTAAVGPTLFGFGFIHGLSLVVLSSLWFGLSAIKSGQVRKHSQIMKSLYWQALGIAGVFALAPGRVLNEWLFAGNSTLGFAAMALGGLAIMWVLWPQKRSVAEA